MLKIIKFIFPVLIFAFLLNAISRDWGATKEYIQNIRLFPLSISFICMMLIYPEGAYAWFRVLKGIDSKVDPKKTMIVWIISNTSRYIPGTIWQYIGRMEMATRMLGVKRQEAGLSLLYEVFLNLSAAGLVSLFSLLYIPSLPKVLFLIIFPLALLFLHPKNVQKLLELLIKILKKKFTKLELKHNFDVIYRSIIWFVINFLLNGLALYFLLIALGGNVPIYYVFALSAFYSLSWLIGYITIIAPGGLGVMEATLVILLSSMSSLTFVSVLAILYRFFLTLAEIVIFMAVLIIYNGRNSKILGRQS